MGTPEVDDTERLRQGDWSRASTVRRAQATPLLAPDTHALLDLPAGEYELRVYTSVERLTLAPGQIAVLNIQRGLGNAKTRSMETEAWWPETVLNARGRHAFLAEPPSRGRPAVVPYFMDMKPSAGEPTVAVAGLEAARCRSWQMADGRWQMADGREPDIDFKPGSGPW